MQHLRAFAFPNRHATIGPRLSAPFPARAKPVGTDTPNAYRRHKVHRYRHGGTTRAPGSGHSCSLHAWSNADPKLFQHGDG